MSVLPSFTLTLVQMLKVNSLCWDIPCKLMPWAGIQIT